MPHYIQVSCLLGPLWSVTLISRGSILKQTLWIFLSPDAFNGSPWPNPVRVVAWPPVLMTAPLFSVFSTWPHPSGLTPVTFQSCGALFPSQNMKILLILPE